MQLEPPAEGATRYERQDENCLAKTLAHVAALRDHLGGAPEKWSIHEVGDGNLNLVFVVQGTRGTLIAKQALPYVRMVGESWPLPISRSHFEHLALVNYHHVCPGFAPQILHHDAGLALTAMEFLGEHVILRRGLMSGIRYPRFADDISTFLSRSLFLTSDLACSAADKKARVAAFAGNSSMCRITEDLVFTEPFFAAPRNRWTAPHLDDVVNSLRADIEIKLAAARLKYVFLTHAEATLHGDLHSGAIMVSADETRVIDAEFAFCGPMSFDVGLLLANLLLSACAQRGHEREAGERHDHTLWLIDTVKDVWNGFHRKFLTLWRAAPLGDAFAAAVFDGYREQQSLESERQAFLAHMLEEALGFAGLEMIRRVVGLAHVIDFDHIADPNTRSRCESNAVTLGRRLILDATRLKTIEAVTGLTRSVLEETRV